MGYKLYGTGLNEKDRYGDLLQKAQEKAEKEREDMLKAIDGVIDWAKQSSKECDEEWLRKDKFRTEMLERAKTRLDNKYKKQ